MCFITKDKDTTSDTKSSDSVPIELEIELAPTSDTIPCPPPNWDEFELE